MMVSNKLKVFSVSEIIINCKKPSQRLKRTNISEIQLRNTIKKSNIGKESTERKLKLVYKTPKIYQTCTKTIRPSRNNFTKYNHVRHKIIKKITGM